MTDGAIVALCGLGIAVVNGIVTVATTIWTNRKVDKTHTDVKEIKKDVQATKAARAVPVMDGPVQARAVFREPEVGGRP